MRKTTLPYIHTFTKRGVTFRYVRKGGKKVRLRLDAANPMFLAEYRAALDGLEPKSGAGDADCKSGTWNALVSLYLNSARYGELRASTQAENKREAKRIRSKWGPHEVSRLEARHVLKWQDELAGEPGKANNMLACLKMLLRFGKARGFKSDQAISEIKELKIGEWRTWTDAELAKFEATWPVGTRERLIYALALYTGQRKGDLLRMTRAHIDVGFIGVTQAKTGERIAIPIHQHLKEAIDGMRSNGLALIARVDGKPLAGREVHDVFAAATAEAGLSGCVLHGLRKAAARRLADAGCSAHEIMAITGHRTLGMVQHYTRGANQKGLARSAMLKLWEHRTRT